jgi:hypothetical protein
MNSTISDYAPTLIILILGLCVLWVLFRIIRAVFRRGPERLEPRMQGVPGETSRHDVSQDLGQEPRREPRLTAHAGPPATIPDAADVLSLKQSIDNLARQIAVLEQRLAGSEALRPTGAGASIRPAPAASAPVPSETPVVVPEHRV